MVSREKVVSITLEGIALVLVFAAAAVFSFNRDQHGQGGGVGPGKLSRKWEKVQLFVMQKRRKLLNRRMFLHHALFLSAMAL